ncbi:SLBB domain-containing protein [Lactococcus garvieae]
MGGGEQEQGSFRKEKAEKDEDEDENEIIVDVKGAVKKPGIYKLSSKNRVSDAVASAGGFTEEAERKRINLAKSYKMKLKFMFQCEGSRDKSLVRNQRQYQQNSRKNQN